MKYELCKKCGKGRPQLRRRKTVLGIIQYGLKCRECGYQTDYFFEKDDVIEAWNYKAKEWKWN